eukprot:gene4486-4533_t
MPMPFRSATAAIPPAMPQLSPGEWRDVQNALRAVEGLGCGGKPTGPLRRSLASIGRIVPGWHPDDTRAIAPELRPLRDFLCESARHGPAVDALADRLEAQGYTPGQIAAISLIAGAAHRDVRAPL